MYAVRGAFITIHYRGVVVYAIPVLLPNELWKLLPVFRPTRQLMEKSNIETSGMVVAV